jgi:hypothetical protein
VLKAPPSLQAVYFGSGYAPQGPGSGKGPWVGADMENGIYEGGSQQASQPSLPLTDFRLAMVNGDSGNRYTLKTAVAGAGGSLTTLYDGPRPPGYQVMKKEGGIVLGIGGDNSPWAAGVFYEGVMVSGYASNQTDNAVAANVIAARYGQQAMADQSPPSPPCQPMQNYQASYVASNYSLAKHMGRYYELAFRDLYPAPPLCDCQHTEKVADTATDYSEEFDFQCNGMPAPNLITLNATDSSLPGVYKQTIVRSMGHDVPRALRTVFNTAVIAFAEGASGFDWVLEFSCGDKGGVIPGGFVGINMYSREVNSTANLNAMIAAANDLGLGWVMNDTKKFVTVPHSSNCKYWPAA